MADKDFVLEFGSFQEVLDGCASRLSEEAMYFESSDAAAVGADVTFEVRIRDGFSVLRGEGEIVRATDEGVFVRLAYLDQPSLKLLPKLVDHYRRQGIPLLELPEMETIEAVEEEGPVEEILEMAEEPTADDLFTAEEIRGTSAPVGLTLDDLEAEFLTDKTDEAEQGPSVDAGARSGTLLVDATAAAVGDQTENVTGIEPEVEPVLIDPQELIADSPEVEETFSPDDIHLDEHQTSDEVPYAQGEEDVPIVAPEVDDPVEEVVVDAGLPWLVEESEEKRGKELWVILLWIVLGAALGAAFYFLVLRPRQESSLLPAEPVEIQARAVPAARQVVESTPVTAEVAEPAAVALRPRSPDPPTDSLTRVNRITWVDESDETVIIFWGDGLFVAEQVDDFRVVGGAPREVVRIRGIRRPFAQQQIDLDTDSVRRIRVGLHEEADGLALHFVADLVDGDVELLRTEAAGEQLRVYFSKAG